MAASSPPRPATTSTSPCSAFGFRRACRGSASHDGSVSRSPLPVPLNRRFHPSPLSGGGWQGQDVAGPNASGTHTSPPHPPLPAHLHARARGCRRRSRRYFCCQAPGDEAVIKRVYSEIEWPPINLTYEKAVCRVDYDDGEAGLYTSVIVLLDNASNTRMEAFVRRFSRPLSPRRHPHLPPCQRSTDGSLLRRPVRSHA